MSSNEFYLTCFAKYLLSSLWLLSICLDMVPSDDRLNSKFSIVPFVVCGTAIYNEINDKLLTM